jgi:hypothetical protein
VAVVVANDYEGLEARVLTDVGLLLHGRDLHHLVLEPRHELVHDLVLLHGQRVEVDLLDGVDPVPLHEEAKLGHRYPLLLRLTATTTSVVAPTAPEPASRNSPTLVVGGGLEQLKKWGSLSPLWLAFGVQQGFLLVGSMASSMGQQVASEPDEQSRPVHMGVVCGLSACGPWVWAREPMVVGRSGKVRGAPMCDGGDCWK